MKLFKRTPKNNELFSVQRFVKSEAQRFKLSNMQKAGFIAYMKSLNKEYVFSAQEFYPYLDKYLGNRK